MNSRIVAAAVLISASLMGQAQFDVASVRRDVLTGEGRNREDIAANAGGLTLHNVTLTSAIQWAYGVRSYQVSGPGWISDYRYEISAKTSRPAEDAQLRAMLQALLADRFKLKLHHESKELTVYALTVAKGGLKMTPGDPNGKSSQAGNGLTLVAKDTPLSEIVENLSRAARAMPDVPAVVDATGLTGRYNFTIDASSVMQTFQAEAAKASPDPSVLVDAAKEVLEEQLGLHAELRKMRADILVIDHAEETPAGN